MFVNHFITEKKKKFCDITTCMKRQFTTLHCAASLNIFRMPTKTREYITLQQFMNDCVPMKVIQFFGVLQISKNRCYLVPPFCFGVEKNPTLRFIMELLRSSPVVNKVTACPDSPCIFYSAPVGHRLRLATSWSQASLSMSPTYHCLIFSFGG